MHITLDFSSRIPLYVQIKNFLSEEILSGSLEANNRLPSTRRLAAELGVNRITIANAYTELESEGLVYGRSGSGTYVSPGKKRLVDTDYSAADYPLWQQRLARESDTEAWWQSEAAASMESNPDVISFSSGMGAEELFPADDYRKALQSVLQQDRGDALGYGELAGYYPLRATISQILSEQGITANPENILITSGSQQAMNLVSRLLLRPGDTILLEDPSYSSAIELFRSLDTNLVGVPVDENGMQVEHVEELLQKTHPALIYTIPNFHNPTGACLSSARRRILVDLADRYNVPILEDEFVCDLRYEGNPRPALKALDSRGNIIYMSTFSKILMPGLRIGYLVASGPVFEQLLLSKRVNDLSTSELIQRALREYIAVGRYETHLNRARRLFRHRRDTMIAAMQRWLPEGTGWQEPQGGLFIWLRLPDGVTTSNLIPAALKEKVSFSPGNLFSVSEQFSSYIRLNFSCQPPELIEEGIRRLGKAVKTSCKVSSNETNHETI